MLRARGAEFGISETSNLARVVADAQPARALAGLLQGAETKMREQSRAATGGAAARGRCFAGIG